MFTPAPLCKHTDCLVRWPARPDGVAVRPMRRLYTRKVGGKSWVAVGWICTKGHVVMEHRDG